MRVWRPLPACADYDHHLAFRTATQAYRMGEERGRLRTDQSGQVADALRERRAKGFVGFGGFEIGRGELQG